MHVTALLMVLALLQSPGAPPGRLAGSVLDVSNAPVAAAAVTLIHGGTTRVTRTAADGSFALEGLPPGAATLAVSAPGLAEVRHQVEILAGRDRAPLRIVLVPAVLSETVTVIARAPGGLEMPSSTSVVSGADLFTQAAPFVDDALRMVPGFSLFRRSSSRTANPSSQGVTLRGVGASGASRTLVRSDKTTLADPFGGWVYWNRIPVTDIDRIEVLRGGGSDLYGGDALGGVVQILTLDANRTRLRTSLEGGLLGTGRASLFAAGRFGGVGVVGSAEAARTSGAIRVSEQERGPIDVEAASRYGTGLVRLRYDGENAFFLRAQFNAFSEERNNGTPLQLNDTSLRELSLEARGIAAGGAWRTEAHALTQGFDQAFTAVGEMRASETLVRRQRIPSRAAGAMVQYQRPLEAGRWMAGAEARWVEGRTQETAFLSNGLTRASSSGGTQRSMAAFAQVNLEPSPGVSVLGGLRIDRWDTHPSGHEWAAASASQVSPRASVAWETSPAIVLGASAYGAFRAPTLNELYRGFRVGDIVTNPASSIDPERLAGVEGSASVSRRSFSARLVAFHQRLADAIANVTVENTPALIIRERRNAGTIFASGLELETVWRPATSWELVGTAALIDSRFDRSSSEPALAGQRVPQVARYHATAQIRYLEPRIVTVSAQVRLVGPQYEDDLNELSLRRALTVDAYASRQVARGAHVFASVENLFDSEIDTGRIPVRTVGLPRAVRFGVRVFLP